MRSKWGFLCRVQFPEDSCILLIEKVDLFRNKSTLILDLVGLMKTLFLLEKLKDSFLDVFEHFMRNCQVFLLSFLFFFSQVVVLNIKKNTSNISPRLSSPIFSFNSYYSKSTLAFSSFKIEQESNLYASEICLGRICKLSSSRAYAYESRIIDYNCLTVTR